MELPILNVVVIDMNKLDWIAEGEKFLGHAEKGSTNRSPIIDKWWKELGASWAMGGAWCGAFVAHCLQASGFTRASFDTRNAKLKGRNDQANVYPYHFYGAKDFARGGGYKLAKPCVGAVAVKSRNGGGHVCFVVGKTPSGRLVVLGGNQGNKVCYTTYAASEFDEGFYWYGRTPNPAQGRYDLPVIKNVSSTKLTEA